MGIELIPRALRARFRFEERGHATAILRSDFRQEFDEILGVMRAFKLKRSDILTPGGGRSPIPIFIDSFLGKLGWGEKSFDIKITVEGQPVPIPTHKIDNFKNRVGVEVEWNNKTEFYDRDLNNFRLLNSLNVLSVGVIITRVSELQALFDEIGKGASYGASTTHWDNLHSEAGSWVTDDILLQLEEVSMNKIFVTVSGGCAYVMEDTVPQGFVLEIIDFDNLEAGDSFPSEEAHEYCTKHNLCDYPRLAGQ